MCLSGAFSGGEQALFYHLAAIKSPTPITAGSLSYLAARQRWPAWWMRIFQRNILNLVAKSIESGIRIFNALAPTALPMEYAAEVADTVPLIRHPQGLDPDSSESETEPQSSGDEQSSSEHSSNAPTLIVSLSDDDTEVQSSIKSSSEHSSNAPTLIVSPSDDDTGVQSSMQSADDRTPGRRLRPSRRRRCSRPIATLGFIDPIGVIIGRSGRGGGVKGPEHRQQDEIPTSPPKHHNLSIAHKIFTIATELTNADYEYRPPPDTPAHK